MLFIPLRKVDAAQRLVEGAIDETPDRAGEIFDYASSKPYFQAWSEGMRKASGGKSLGNIRAMHQDIAAGKLDGIAFDDAAKAIRFAARIIDDSEWAKVAAGVYTGFSPGGRYVKRWDDGALTRYTAAPSEISIVDLPCIPSATFTLVKADGLTEEMAFRGRKPLDERALLAKLQAAKSPGDYGAAILAAPASAIIGDALDIGDAYQTSLGLNKAAWSAELRQDLAAAGHAMPDGALPVETVEDLMAAIPALGYLADPIAGQAYLTKRAVELKATDRLPGDWAGSTAPELAKGLGDVAALSQMIHSLIWLAETVAAQGIADLDAESVAPALAAWVGQGLSLLQDLSTQETQTALERLQAAVAAFPAPVAPEPESMALAAQPDGLAKEGRRHSAEDLKTLQQIHDGAAALGATCAGAKVEKSAGLAKLGFELAVARGDLAKLAAENLDLTKRLQALADAPRAGGPRLRALAKGEDAGAPPAPAPTSPGPTGDAAAVAPLTRHALLTQF